MSIITNPTIFHAKSLVKYLEENTLTAGLGVREPGKMCVEAAVCYVLGEKHSDKPSCVGEEIRSYKIRLNDARWGSNEERTAGMREIAIAQLGSNEIDQKEFSKRILLKVIQRILPTKLRAAARLSPVHATALENAALACETALDLVQATSAVLLSTNAAYDAHDGTVRYARDALIAAGYVAEAFVERGGNDHAYIAASAAVYAADAVLYAAEAQAAPDTSVLKTACDIGVEVLTELGCKGVQWLSLLK